jgi:hypothetical protein
VHPDAWLITMDRPATVIVPLRAGPMFGATVNGTVPVPAPPAVPTVIHTAFDAAVQPHPGSVVTATADEAPPFPAA